ncbi:DUF4381 family protein [Lysobacter sp. SG-8]|uniref:DUF4381 family protein n=1 Tax=Marilutibacter penaei TaxID=2759900 RepID=A0A7W3U3K2_9GAMM|nr:DUF4381 family protein [Lysobacter penaei]MBB1088294.1 DUF4381 family protein [Lysobacter penaei]
MAGELVLRDIHLPPPPPWWPPAPGWWMVFAAAVAVILSLAAWRHHRKRRRRRIEATFDDALAAADSPVDEVAAMSSLLRRAARRHRRDADTLHGRAWREWLDRDCKPPRFDGEAGALLVEGGFQRALDPAAVAALRPLARACFLELMGYR